MTAHATLAIRADATASIGAGHVMRCIALGQEAQARGMRVVLAGRVESPALRDRLERDGIAVADVPDGGTGVQALRGAGLEPGQWVVLDGYAFTAADQQALRGAGFRVLAMDDKNELPRHEADVILNQDPAAPVASYEARHEALVLGGTPFRLLRREFAGARKREVRDLAEGARILVTFGGADTKNLSRAVMGALAGVLGALDTVRVVVGPVNKHLASLEAELDGLGYRCELLRDVRDMPAQMAWADVAVAAGGGTAWEFAALGLPALLVAVADNQEPGVRALAEAGAAVAVGGAEAVGGSDFSAAVRGLLDSRKQRQAMADAGQSLVDGRGAGRVLQLMEALSGKVVHNFFSLRAAGPEDALPLLRMANDPVKRANAFSPEPIPLDGHLRWYAGRLAARGESATWVLDLHGAVAAQVRYDKSGQDAAIVDIGTHRAFWGHGLGSMLLERTAEAASRELGVSTLRAEVFEENTASRRCFEKAGYVPAGTEDIQGRRCVVYTWSEKS